MQIKKTQKENLARLVLARLPDMTAEKKAELIRIIGHHRNLLDPNLRLSGLPLSAGARKDLALWRTDPDRAYRALEKDRQWLQKPENLVLMPEDSQYPERLKHLPQPPLPLYLRGNAGVAEQPLITFAGSMHPSRQAKEMAYRMAAELSALGFCIVAGLSEGIAQTAHRGALGHKGMALAVAASGLDGIRPETQKKLAESIRKKGALLSEYPPEKTDCTEQNAARNRILGALSWAVVLIEAEERSCAIDIAEVACEQGLEVMAVPGSPKGSRNTGSHRLIREGATLVENTPQILQCLSHIAKVTTKTAAPSGKQQLLLEQLGKGPAPVDLLAWRLGWPLVQVAKLLLQLQQDGLVYREAGGYIRAD